MCEPIKKDPVGDVLAIVGGIVTGATAAVTAAARVTVRLGCRWSSDEQLERARWVLCWRLMLEAVVAAIVVYYLGRAAMFVFAGVAVASFTVGYFVFAELRRRQDEAPEAEAEPEIELHPDGRPHLEAV